MLNRRGEFETWKLPATTQDREQLKPADIQPTIKEDFTTILVVSRGFASIASALFAQRSQRFSFHCLGLNSEPEAIESFTPAPGNVNRPSVQY